MVFIPDAIFQNCEKYSLYRFSSSKRENYHLSKIFLSCGKFNLIDDAIGLECAVKGVIFSVTWEYDLENVSFYDAKRKVTISIL